MAAALVNAAYRRVMRRERVFVDRQNPLEVWTDGQIRDRFRFRRNTVLIILRMIGIDLQHPTDRSHALPALLQLCLALRFLATGSYLLVVGDTLPRVSKASVCRCVWRVCSALMRFLPGFVHMPQQAHLEKVKKGFLKIAGIPNVIGLIDCTHVPILAPSGEREPDYVNRKGQHSLNVQLVCDHNFVVTNIVAKWPGSVHDARIFRESQLCAELENGAHRGYLLGDSGYPCRSFQITPYPNPQPGPQTTFNKAHSRTRVRIEQTNGILKTRFPCLKSLRVTPERAVKIIASCVILHNLARLQQDDINYDDALHDEDETPVEPDMNNLGDGVIVRHHITRTIFT